MSFSVRLAADAFEVEPGASVAVAVEIVNDSDERDQLELSVEGLDVEWVAIPVPTFWVEPHETHVERLFLKPSREPENTAGAYPFVVKVRSLESGASKPAQGTLKIESFYHLSVDVNPRKASVSPANRNTKVEVTVMNLGNVEQALQLFASDVDDAFSYEFSNEHVTLGPGQQKTLDLTASARKVSLMAGTRLASATITARNVQNPAVAGSGQAVFELRPLIAPGPFLLLLTCIALAVGWILSIPKKPEIEYLRVSPTKVEAGQEIEIEWQATSGRVTIDVSGQVTDKLPATHRMSVIASVPGTLVISAKAVSGNLQSQVKTITVEVTAPPEIPKPEIKSFAATDSSVPIGSPATLTYLLSDSVTYAYLEPFGQIDPKAKSIQVPSPVDDLAGVGEKSLTFTLRAENSAKVSVTRSVTVKFFKASQAKILSFVASPEAVPPLDGRVTVKWQVANASRVEFSHDGQTEEVSSTDEREMVVSQETKFKIIAYDAQGLPAEKTVTVKVKEPDPPTVDPPTTGGAGTTTTTGGTGAAATAGGTGKPVSDTDGRFRQPRRTPQGAARPH